MSRFRMETTGAFVGHWAGRQRRTTGHGRRGGRVAGSLGGSLARLAPVGGASFSKAECPSRPVKLHTMRRADSSAIVVSSLLLKQKWRVTHRHCTTTVAVNIALQVTIVDPPSPGGSERAGVVIGVIPSHL